MEWTDESITRLRSLWQEGLSTAEIGRRMQITKNAVVGKAHRLTLPPRPSPIRKSLERPGHILAPAPIPVQRPRLIPAPRTGSDAAASPPPAQPVVAASDGAPPRRSLSVVGVTPPAAVRHATGGPAPSAEAAPPALRTVAAAPRRRGLTCCWPLGDPGTKGFHFCGGEPITGKPYCAEHAALAYVRIRDRRDSVA